MKDAPIPTRNRRNTDIAAQQYGLFGISFLPKHQLAIFNENILMAIVYRQRGCPAKRRHSPFLNNPIALELIAQAKGFGGLERTEVAVDDMGEIVFRVVHHEPAFALRLDICDQLKYEDH